MRVLWLATMFPTELNWLAGPWNVRGLMALRDHEGQEVRVVCPIGMTPPGRFARGFPFNLGEIRKWRHKRQELPLAGEVKGIPVTYPRWSWGPKRLFWGYEGWLMYRQLRRHLADIVATYRPDVIHTPWLAPEGVAASLMGQEHGIPVVVQGIGNDANYYLASYPGRDYVIHQIRKAPALLFNCQSTMRMAAEVGLTHRNTVIIYHGVEVDLFKPDPDRQGNGRKIITVAQLIPRKNHQLLLHAFTRLPEALRSTASLEFVGGGASRPELEKLAVALGLKNKVHFAGQPSHAELVKCLQSAHLYCLPTLSEGMPVAIIEAMACGLPIVASKVDGIPESVREPDCGILVPPQDLDALAAALADALTRDWDRAAIRQRVLDNFTWQLYAKNVSDLYVSLQS